MSNPKLKRDTALEAGGGVLQPVFRKPDFIGTESVPVPTFGAHDSIAAGGATFQPLNVHDYLNKDKYDKLPIHERPVIGFDCEYTYELKTNSNQVLSYQWCVYHKGSAHSGIHYVKNGKRLKFKKLISIALESAKEAGVLTGSEEQFLLGAHFSRADISLLEDFFEGLFKDLSVLRKTFLSFEEKPYDIDLESFTKSMFKSQKLNYWDQSRNKKTVHIQFMDTMTLSPGGRSLADLGDFLGVKKLEFPEHLDISRMDLVLEQEPDFFEAYAIRDAEIAAKYLARVVQFISTELFAGEDGTPAKVYRMPATLGGMGTSSFKKKVGDSFGELFGLTSETHKEWNSKSGRFITKKGWIYKPISRAFIQFAVESYHGGMNVAFQCGLTPVKTYEDWDLASCYTTAMMGLRPLDFENVKHTTNPDDFAGDVYAIAYVRFSFPSSVDKPMLAVRSDHGLIFPRTGETFCTGLEVVVAKNLGAEVNIVHGMVIPWASDARIFQPFMQMVRAQRMKHPKGSLFERLWKEIGNSMYGKLAQGLRNKTIFDISDGQNRRMPKSDLTNAYYASYVTGVVRAVAGEILNNLPEGAEVLNFITDGFLFAGGKNDIDISGPAATLFQAFFKCIDPDGESILERKHVSSQVMIMKTRGHVSVEGQFQGAPICAKAGQKVPRNKDQVPYMNSLYKNRIPGQKVDASHLTPVRAMLHERRDMVMEEKEQTLNLEFDCKRRLINPRMNRFPDGTEHIYMDTEPFDTLGDMLLYKSFFEAFRREHCLKNMEDWHAWVDFYSLKMAVQGMRGVKGLRTTKDLLVKSFVQCWSINTSGLDNSLIKAKELYDWLSGEGVELFKSANSLTSVRRSPWKTDFSECVPATDGALKFLVAILDRFPEFQYEDAFLESDLESVKNYLETEDEA